MSVAEDERKKLARDLHDELGQMLTALRFVLDSLQISLPVNSEGMREKCCEALGLVEQIGSSIRNMLFELRPSMLDDLGFGPTVEWYLTRFRRQKPSVKVTFDALGVKGRLQPEQEIVLFRVLQECLNNISKHSGAENVEVSLTYSYPKIIFVVKDDGVGFDQTGERLVSDAETRGIGLLGMSERVASVDGTFDVISSRGKGTIVRVEMVDSRGATDEEDKNTDCG
jgi:signal transduction histidine kinase